MILHKLLDICFNLLGVKLANSFFRETAIPIASASSSAMCPSAAAAAIRMPKKAYCLEIDLSLSLPNKPSNSPMVVPP